MSKIMSLILILSCSATVLAAVLFRYFNNNIYLSVSITFGTIAYHIGIRLLVGLLFNMIMKNRADYTKKWYQMRSWENKLYRFLKVKKWKHKMPTYDPEVFSSKKHTWDEIAQAMCQSELVHETNMVLSFIPLIFSIHFGSFYVFLITSICSAVFDFIFVMMQRYNRPRVVNIALRKH